MPTSGDCDSNSLEALAAKCRRLASAIPDQRATEALTRLAEEYERQVQGPARPDLGVGRLSGI